MSFWDYMVAGLPGWFITTCMLFTLICSTYYWTALMVYGWEPGVPGVLNLVAQPLACFGLWLPAWWSKAFR